MSLLEQELDGLEVDLNALDVRQSKRGDDHELRIRYLERNGARLMAYAAVGGALGSALVSSIVGVILGGGHL